MPCFVDIRIVKLHRLLIKDFDEERATANARQDWERDVQVRSESSAVLLCSDSPSSI